MELIQQNLHQYTEHLKQLDKRKINSHDIPNYVQFKTMSQALRDAGILKLYKLSKHNGAHSATIFFQSVYLWDYTLSRYSRPLTESEHNALITASYMLSFKYQCGDIFNQSISSTIIAAEYHIFQALEFNLVVPNMMLVLRLISWELAQGEERARTMARILMTCALFDKSYIKYNAVQIASACMIVACKIKQRPTDAIEEFCQCDATIYPFIKRAFNTYKDNPVIKDIEASRNVQGTLVQINDYFAQY